MASNFPDTSVNNPETGVPWVDGDTWFDSSSDYTYIWYSPVWRTGEASGSDFVKVAGDNMTGDLTLGTNKITLDATNGLAAFALQTITGTSSQGTFVNAAGANRIAVNSGAAGTVFNVNDTGVVVTNDRLVCNAGGNKNDSADAFLVYKQDGTTTGASITAGGSATFASDVVADTINIQGTGAQSKLDTEVSDFVISTLNTGGGLSEGFRLSGGSNPGPGDATFKGSITMSSPSAGSGSIQAFGVYALGDGTAAASIKTNGSGDFAARLTAGVSTLADRAIVGASNTSAGNGGTITAFQYSTGGEVWNGFFYNTQTSTIFADGTISGKNVTFNLEADDDTKYTSTTDSEGEVTRVYNGAVLDVKDRIQNVLARMDAIEANEITDDATDSALLTLIASLSARLDERDTAIAALTARVSTLES